MGRLSNLAAKNAKPGRHADGEGLYLLVKPTGARSFLLRIQQDGRRRDIGLGSFDAAGRVGTAADEVPILHRRVLTLAEAREKAAILRRFAKGGRDPAVERDRDRSPAPTFRDAAIACHRELSAGWRAKHAAAFLSSLQEHAFARLGNQRVDEIEAPHINTALLPIWTDIPVMARKVRQRISTVLTFAQAKGWRTAEAPGKAVTLGLAKHKKGGNFAAMPYADVPAFVGDLRDKFPTTGRSALLFTILTAARSGEVRAARWSQIDLDAATWSRPAEMMKSREPHAVTLNGPAVQLLRDLDGAKLVGADRLIFPGTGERSLSDMTLTKVLRDAKQPYTVHGFRSSFRDWAAEQMPTIPDAVAEAALAHAVSDKVVAAYRRTTFIDMRRTLLKEWGLFLSGGSPD